LISNFWGIYETGFPEDANMKAPGGFFIFFLEPFSYATFPEPKISELA